MTLVFVFCTIIIFQQTYFVVTADPGFEPANLVRLSIRGLTQNEAARLQASLSEHPLVATCVREDGSAEVQMRDSNGNLIDGVITYEADGDFLKTLGLKLLQGKSLYPNPIQSNVIVNEAFLKRLASAQPLGQVITQADENTSSREFGRNVSGRIVGVVKDFHFRDLRHTAPPTVIAIADDATTFLFKGKYITGEILIRIQENSADQFVPYLEKLWKDLKIGGLLTFSYVEDERQKFYAKEISWSKIVSGAALCAGHDLPICGTQKKGNRYPKGHGCRALKNSQWDCAELCAARVYSRCHRATAILFLHGRVALDICLPLSIWRWDDFDGDLIGHLASAHGRLRTRAKGRLRQSNRNSSGGLKGSRQGLC